jgi:ATP-dependent 26S proteasome regulatory subunit
MSAQKDQQKEIDDQLALAERVRYNPDLSLQLEALAYYTIAIKLMDKYKLTEQAEPTRTKIQQIADNINASVAKKEDETGDKINVLSSRQLADFTFDKLAGLDKEKLEIRNIFIYPNVFQKLYKKPKGGVLLYGPPGTGMNTLQCSKFNIQR